MEEEEGYMALNFKPRKEHESTSRGSFQMEEEEGYMALNFKPRKEHGAPQRTQWHRVALGMASVVVLLLIGVVITLASWVLQSKGTKCLPDPEFRLQLKHFACSSPGNSTKEDVKKCKICPQDWRLHRESCYWISDQQNNWAKSQEDCRAKNSTLVVIQNSEEKMFIENFIEKTGIWLGLTAKPSENGAWEWVDGSPLKEELFYVSGPAEENSCVMKRKNEFNSEVCGVLQHWICEKIAFQV